MKKLRDRVSFPPNSFLVVLPLSNYFVFAMIRNSVSMVFPELGNEFHLIEVQMGFLISTQLLAGLLTGLIAGPVEGNVGRRAAMGAGLLLIFLGVLGFGLSGSYLTVFGSLAMIGCGQGLFVTILYSFMGEILPKARGLIIGLASSIYALGGFTGPWFTGNFTMLYTWRLPFLFFASLGIVALIVERLFFKYPPPLSIRRVSFSVSTLGLLKVRNIRILLLTMFLANFSVNTFATWTPTFLRIIREIDVSTAGLIFGLVSGAAVPGNIFFGSLSDKYPRKKIASIIGFGAGSAALLLYVGGNVPLIAGVSALYGLLARPHWNLHITQAQDSVGPESRTAATALIRVAAASAGITAPIITGLLIPIFGFFWVLVYSVSIPLLLYALTILLVRSLPDSPGEN